MLSIAVSETAVIAIRDLQAASEERDQDVDRLVYDRDILAKNSMLY